MMPIKEEIKKGLLLSPQQLLKNTSIIQALTIRKTAADISFKATDLDSREINSIFSQLPKAAKQILINFSVEYSNSRSQGIRSRYKTGRAGMIYTDFYEAAVLRELHGLFERIKPFTSLFKWYHKVWQDNSNAKTGPCIFSTYKPQLQFEVKKENGGLIVKTQIFLNGTIYSIEEFKQYHFLLASGNEYFLLSFKDYQTLNWLWQNKPEQYQLHPNELAQNILARLEEDYQVNRNGLFSQISLTYCR